MVMMVMDDSKKLVSDKFIKKYGTEITKGDFVLFIIVMIVFVFIIYIGFTSIS